MSTTVEHDLDYSLSSEAYDSLQCYRSGLDDLVCDLAIQIARRRAPETAPVMVEIEDVREAGGRILQAIRGVIEVGQPPDKIKPDLDWFPDAVASLDELAHLPVNWDSYGAGTIRHASILATLELLLRIMRENTPLPALVPTNRRTVLLEWHARGIDLEVEVHGADRLQVAFEDSRDGTEWEAELGSDLTRLVECVERLSNKE